MVESTHILVYVGLLLLASQVAGRLASLIRVPRVVGYLLAFVVGVILLTSGCAITLHSSALLANRVLGLLSRETAGGIMRKQPIFATVDEAIGVVARRMLEASVNEIPVLHADRRVIADITIVDLLEHLLGVDVREP